MNKTQTDRYLAAGGTQTAQPAPDFWNPSSVDKPIGFLTARQREIIHEHLRDEGSMSQGALIELMLERADEEREYDAAKADEFDAIAAALRANA
jgi:hypothetical protein